MSSRTKAETASSSSSGSENRPPQLLSPFAPLFYATKLLGVYPFSWRAFRQEPRQLRSSRVGAVAVAAMLLFSVLGHNALVFSFEGPYADKPQSLLTVAMGVLLTYFGPLVSLVDMVLVVWNQRAVAVWCGRLQALDEQLWAASVPFDNAGIRLRLIGWIVYVAANEVTMVFATFWMLGWRTPFTVLFVFSMLPTLFDSLDKIWFVELLRVLLDRFRSLNAYIEAMAERHDANANNATAHAPSTASHLFSNRVTPEPATRLTCFGEVVTNPQLFARPTPPARQRPAELSDAAEVLEEHLSLLCQLHDTACTLAKELNELWAYQNVAALGYNFVMVTAQLYFAAVALLDETIPGLFRLVEHPLIFTAYMIYTSVKGVALLYTNHAAMLESRRTGVCLHKCAVAADTNGVYETVNHLSLKLMQHGVDFCSSGFLALDMTTMFALMGTIATYSIILIQFKLSGVQYAAGLAATATNVSSTSSTAAAAAVNGTIDLRLHIAPLFGIVV